MNRGMDSQGRNAVSGRTESSCRPDAAQALLQTPGRGAHRALCRLLQPAARISAVRDMRAATIGTNTRVQCSKRRGEAARRPLKTAARGDSM